MRRPTRRLSDEERAIWAKVAQTVKPLQPVRPRPKEISPTGLPGSAVPAPLPLPPAKKVKGRVPAPLPSKALPAKPLPPRSAPDHQPHLDGTWERRIGKGTLSPDFSLDLHGANLDQAYMRLIHGLTQARAMGARVVLIVTGKPRPAEAADRSERRGAIRAKIADWLAASEHAGDIVAIRGAHPRHGGQGAIYVILRKRR